MSESTVQHYKKLCYAIFVLIVLGGSVRVMNAGLACPDWPLCFGDIIPDYHPEVYFEFIHRALAGLIGIASIYLNVLIYRNRELTWTLRYLSVAASVLLVVQVIMGGLTVLMQLHDKIVALHLSLGTGFFALSFWIYLSLKKQTIKNTEQINLADSKRGAWVSVIALVSIYGQIILGGLVASNYAASVCPEFPLCHGEFIPTLQGTIGLHVIHRLGAYTLCLILTGLFIYTYKNINCSHMKKFTQKLMIGLFFQICLGIANVLYFTPPVLAVLHLALGVYLLSVAVRMLSWSVITTQSRADSLEQRG